MTTKVNIHLFDANDLPVPYYHRRHSWRMKGNFRFVLISSPMARFKGSR